MLESVTRALRVGKLERLDKLLSSRGVGSRSEVDVLLRQGRVCVEGNVIKKRGARFPSDCKIAVSDKVYHPVPVLAVFHKPIGMISSMHDKWERTDLSKNKESYPFLKSMHPVGRLDVDTTGLLLFSRDGNLTNSLLLPSSGVEREYQAVVDGAICLDELKEKLSAGVRTADGTFTAVVIGGEVLQNTESSHLETHEAASEGSIDVRGEEAEDSAGYRHRKLSPYQSVVRLIVQEGKHRMVRRMLHNVGHSVLQLRRERFGGISLDGLPPGECRAITDKELSWVMSFFKKIRKASWIQAKSDKEAKGEIKKEKGSSSGSSGGGVTVKDSEAKEKLTVRSEFNVIGKDKKKINEWKQGSLGAKGSRRFQ